MWEDLESMLQCLSEYLVLVKIIPGRVIPGKYLIYTYEVDASS